MALNPQATATLSSPVEVSLTVENITDDQVDDDAERGHGCGKPSDKQGSDWQPIVFPTDPVTGTLQLNSDQVGFDGLQLRAERCARDGTRTYTVTVICCDTTNGVCDDAPGEDLHVTVPKSKGHSHS